MKNVIFRGLFLNKKDKTIETSESIYNRRCSKLSYNAQIVYSAYIWYAISNSDCPFMNLWLCGDLDAMEELCLYSYQHKQYRIEFTPPSNKWLEDYCKLPRSSIVAAIDALWHNDLIDSFDHETLVLYIDEDIMNSGYIELIYPSKENTAYLDNKTNKIVKINSHDIIIYSYLKYKSQKYGGCIDTYISKLAIELSVCERDIKRYLARLKDFRLIERLPDGRLKIN